MSKRYRRRGQAAVETVITMPLVVFMVLSSMQLFTLLQARILGQYALGRATRLSAVNFGKCGPMRDTMLMYAVPALDASFAKAAGPAARGAAFATVATQYIQTNRFTGREWSSAAARGAAGVGDVIWLESRVELTGPAPADEENEWNLPGSARTLQTRLVFWVPLKMPFADWVFQRIALASWGAQAFNGTRPYNMVARGKAWESGGRPGANNALPDIAGELSARTNAGQRVFPVTATTAMRMMSPARNGPGDLPLFNTWQACR